MSVRGIRNPTFKPVRDLSKGENRFASDDSHTKIEDASDVDSAYIRLATNSRYNGFAMTQIPI